VIKSALSYVLCVAMLAAAQQAGNAPDEPVFIQGKKFVFTVKAPSGWVLDAKRAKQQNVKAWFRPERNPSDTKTYMYAYGVDTDGTAASYPKFIEKDQQTWKKKYPGLESKEVTLDISGAIREACVYRMSGMSDRFKIEVVYARAEKATIVLVFSAESKGYYNHYGEQFDAFLATLDYLGDNPEKILNEQGAEGE